MKIHFFILSIIMGQSLLAQVQVNPNVVLSQEFSKEISLNKAKSFLIQNVLNTTEDVLQFEIFPLAASDAEVLTSMVYRCESNNLEGLILGFYGEIWSNTGIVYKGYDFKNFSKDAAIVLLNKIQQALVDHTAYLNMNIGNNNIYFKYDDIYVSVYRNMDIKIRVIWKDFNSEWSLSAFNRTKNKLEGFAE